MLKHLKSILLSHWLGISQWFAREWFMVEPSPFTYTNLYTNLLQIVVKTTLVSYLGFFIASDRKCCWLDWSQIFFCNVVSLVFRIKLSSRFVWSNLIITSLQTGTFISYLSFTLQVEYHHTPLSSSLSFSSANNSKSYRDIWTQDVVSFVLMMSYSQLRGQYTNKNTPTLDYNSIISTRPLLISNFNWRIFFRGYCISVVRVRRWPSLL